MFPMIGCYGMNPFGGWGCYPQYPHYTHGAEIGFLLGFAAATVAAAVRPSKTNPTSGSLFTNPYIYNQTPYQTNTQVPITNTNTTPIVGNFGSLTATNYNDTTTGFTGLGNYDMGLPYYPTTFTTPNVAIVANNLANNIVNNINTQMQAQAQALAQAQAQASQNQSLSTQTTSSSDVSEQDIGSTSNEGMFLKGKGRGTQYGPAFLAKVKKIANNLNCNYRDLIAIFNSEFGVEANKTAKNGAVGLICFMPQYFDTQKIVRMSPIEQLDVVENTIMKSKKQAGFAPNARLSKADLYALVFLPARANRDILCRKGEGNRFYESNAALDYNKDGAITKSEMAHRIDNKYVSDQTFLA